MKDWKASPIVVGLDGSEHSLNAARVAASLAREVGSRLILVTVVRPPEGWWGIVGSGPPADALGDSLYAAQRDILDRTVEGVDLSGVEYETREEIGEPSAQLIALCETLDASLLVVGRRGAGLLRRMVVGSVAGHVADEAPVPVLVVP